MSKEIALLLEEELLLGVNTDFSIETKSAVSTVLKSLQKVFIGAGELAKNVYNAIKRYIAEIFSEMADGNLATIFKVIFCITAIVGLTVILLSGNVTIKNMAYVLGKKIGLIALWFKEKFQLTAEVVYKYSTSATERLKDSFKKSMKDVGTTMKKSAVDTATNALFVKPAAVHWAEEMPETVWGSFKLGVMDGFRKPTENNTLWSRIKNNFKTAITEGEDQVEQSSMLKKIIITIMFTVLIIVIIYVSKFVFEMYKSGDNLITAESAYAENYSILDKIKLGLEVFYKSGTVVALDGK